MIPISTASVIRDAIIDDRLDLHVALPGEIQKVNSDKSLEIRLCVKRWVPVGEEFVEESLPVLKNVPLAVWRNGAAAIWLPPKKGDKGIVLFMETSISQWLASGTIEIPEDPGRHTMSSGVFIPCLTIDTETAAFTPQKDGLVVGYIDGAFIAVEEDGTVTAENSAGGFELKPSGQLAVNGTNLTVDP